MKTRLNRQKLKAVTDCEKYTYNVFISCEHRDAKLFVKRRLLPTLETKETKLKFCVAQRDFIVGATIIDHIMRAINRSRKIIFIISEYFLTSNWCKEELQIAQQVYFVLVDLHAAIIILHCQSLHTFKNIFQISIDRGENIIICIFMSNVK